MKIQDRDYSSVGRGELLDELKIVYENLTHAQERGTALHNQVVELKAELAQFRRPVLEFVFGKKTADLILKAL